MYGMVTNLSDLTTGTPAAPGWSPKDKTAPKISGKTMWTYGGAGCTPEKKPNSAQDIDDIVSATQSGDWAGVDFDDECHMNVDMLIESMGKLQSNSLQTSYTFLAGWDYNNPDASDYGKSINDAVQNIATSKTADRLVLMCYGGEMWSMDDIKANVGPAITRTIDNEVPADQVILALTPAGLTQENLEYFLDQVKSKGIGGLFVWNFLELADNDLQTIEKSLGIG